MPKFPVPFITEILILQLKRWKREGLCGTRSCVKDDCRVCGGSEVDSVVDENDGSQMVFSRKLEQGLPDVSLFQKLQGKEGLISRGCVGQITTMCLSGGENSNAVRIEALKEL